MPISVQISSDLVAGEAAHAEATGGGLDPNQVYIQFVCTTNDHTGAHDPNVAPAAHVRPWHAALHGTIWRIDDPKAPIPPLDFGCRCAMAYVSKPGSVASRVLPEAPKDPEVSAVAPAQRWLTANVSNWEEIAKAGDGNLAKLVLILRKKGIDNPRDIAALMLQALKG